MDFVERTKGGYILRHEAEEITVATFDEAQKALRFLSDGKGVIVHLTGVPAYYAQRILDFLSGAVYMSGCTLRKVDKDSFLLIPEGVKITKLRK